MNKKIVPPDEPKPVAMVTVAVLDASGVYRGLKSISDVDMTDAHIVLPADCDLKAGYYRWDAARKTFDPLPASQVSVDGGPAPSVEAVVAELAKEALASGSKSQVLAEFLAAYSKSVDAIGSKT